MISTSTADRSHQVSRNIGVAGAIAIATAGILALLGLGEQAITPLALAGVTVAITAVVVPMLFDRLTGASAEPVDEQLVDVLELARDCRLYRIALDAQGMRVDARVYSCGGLGFDVADVVDGHPDLFESVDCDGRTYLLPTRAGDELVDQHHRDRSGIALLDHASVGHLRADDGSILIAHTGGTWDVTADAWPLLNAGLIHSEHPGQPATLLFPTRTGQRLLEHHRHTDTRR